MAIDISTLDNLQNRFEKAPDGKWYARTYNGPVVVYEDEITGYYGGPVPGELQDVFAAQRLAATGKVVTATTNLTGGIELSAGGVPVDFSELATLSETYPDFAPSVLASLSIGSTYGQSGTLVTVVSTAHAIPANQNGCRIFWPGSAAIAAGWYLNWGFVDANTFTFTNPTSQTVAGGSAITGSLPYTTETIIFSTTIGANKLAPNNSSVTHSMYCSGDNTPGSKQFKTLLNSQTLSVCYETNGTTGFLRNTFVTSRNKLLGVQSAGDGALATTGNQYTRTADLTSSNSLKMSGQLSGANMWLSVEHVTIEVRK